jgi:large subunit ribosomal protein L19
MNTKQIFDFLEKLHKPKLAWNLNIGDIVKINYKFLESGKERIQIYKGVIIAIQNKKLGKTFTLRRQVQGIGVEQIIPYYSPKISLVTIESQSKIRRAKLYYLRYLIGKAAKLKKKIK